MTFIHFYAAPGVRPSQLLHKICTITSTAWSIFEPTDALQSLDVPHSEIHRALQLNVRWRTVQQQLRVSLMGGSVTQCSLCEVVHKTASILILRVQCTQCVEICTAVERSALMQSLLRTAMHSFSFLPSCSCSSSCWRCWQWDAVDALMH